MNAAREFITALEQSLSANSFVKISLGHYKGKEADLKNIYIRKILIKREEKLSFTYHYKTRDIVKNYDNAEAAKKITRYLDGEFLAATLFTTQSDFVLEKGTLKTKPPTSRDAPALEHDRSKKRLVQTANRHYLHALGITDDKGNVLKNAQDKYRQIDKYVEILGGLVKTLPQDKIKQITDMGAGKGYLTFALYDYLTATMKLDTKVTGVEARPDLVKLCNDIAAESDFSGLNFEQGTIENFDSAGTNILIALHACDTATDAAIHKGITAGAELIVVAPCCHKQIRREMEQAKTDNNLEFLTRHGIFLERQAEMVTDGMRALILEYFGYTTKIFEFVGGEHTPKNVMITATKTKKSKDAKILKTITETKEYFGISSHALEKMMGI